MPKSITYLCAFVVAAVAVAAQAPKSPQKPGKWQTTVETEMPGMPMKMPAMTSESCLTAEDLADPQKAVPSDAKSSCTVSDYKVKDNTVSWTVDCPKEKMKGSGEMTYSENSYTGTVKMKMDQQEVTQKYTGKWLGTCTK